MVGGGATPETLHTLDPSLLSFPALSAGMYTNFAGDGSCSLMMEAVVPSWKLSRLLMLTVAMSKQDFSAR
jgi:hypothetical protein